MCRLLSGFSARNLWISLAEVMAAFLPSLVAGARLLFYVPGCWRRRRSAAGEWMRWFALGGGPPEFWKVPGLPAVIGLGPVPGGVRDPPPGTGAVVYPAVSAFSPLSMMICSTSLAVYPQRTSWFR